MKAAKLVFSVIAAALVVTACKNSSVDFQKTSGGVPYKIFSGKDKGDSVKKDYVVKCQVIRKIGDSIVFSSYQNNFPQYIPVQPPPGNIEYADIASNIMEILPHAKQGDSIYVVQSADTLIKKDSLNLGGLKKGQQITYTIRIEKVFKTEAEARAAFEKDREVVVQAQIKENMKKEQENLENFKKNPQVADQMAKDSKTIEDYLKANNIQAQKTNWGVYVQVLEPGQEKPQPGEWANVQYRGTTLAGQEFDAGVYPLQIGTGGAIKGFEEGVVSVGKGGKAKVFVPSALAYGAQGNGPKIGPNTVLVFDIQLLDVTKTRPMQPGQPGQ